MKCMKMHPESCSACCMEEDVLILSRQATHAEDILRRLIIS
jgi:hypothetical protein